MPATQDTCVLRALQRQEEYAKVILLPSSKMRAYSVCPGSEAGVREVGYTPATAVAVYPIPDPVSDLREQLNEAMREISRLRREVDDLKAASNMSVVVEDPIEVDFNQAKTEIAALFDARGHLAYSDLIRELGLDLDIVIAACDELTEEGRIRECSQTQ